MDRLAHLVLALALGAIGSAQVVEQQPDANELRRQSIEMLRKVVGESLTALTEGRASVGDLLRHQQLMVEAQNFAGRTAYDKVLHAHENKGIAAQILEAAREQSKAGQVPLSTVLESKANFQLREAEMMEALAGVQTRMIEVMKTSVRNGELRKYPPDEVLGWAVGGVGEFDGVPCLLGVAKVRNKNFGPKYIALKAYLGPEKVKRWVYAKTDLEVK